MRISLAGIVLVLAAFSQLAVSVHAAEIKVISSPATRAALREVVPQFERAFRNGFRGKLEHDGGRLLRELPDRLRDHEPSPSLVHGDLWQGNAGTLPDGTPVVFDPAVYVGDADVDLAMTELFGGFGTEFMRAYESVRPIAPGYPMRRDLYNLYHLLNHLNLFGAGYLGQVKRTLGLLRDSLQ